MVPRLTAKGFVEYLQDFSTVAPPKIHDLFSFYHSDLNPTNILVSTDGDAITGIVDWDTRLISFGSGTTKPLRWIAFLVNSSDPEFRNLLGDGLQVTGYMSELDRFRAWRSAIFKKMLFKGANKMCSNISRLWKV